MTGIDGIASNPVATETALTGALLVVLLALSALFSGSETAYFSLTPSALDDLRESDSHKGRTVAKLMDKPEKLLSTLLIADSLVNVSIVLTASLLASSLPDFGMSAMLQIVVQIVVITLLILIFGEVLPKIYAARHSRSVALGMAYPLTVLTVIFSPLSRLMMKSSETVNARLAKHQQNMSIDDLSQALELTRDGISEEKDMLEGIVKFTNLCANDIMKPRLDVVSVDINYNFNKVLQVVVESGYSRIPVYDERPDNIKGILYVKDLLPHINKGNNFDWKTLIRKAYYIPDTKKINNLLAEFQTSKTHMAIVVDEYGGMSGIVTLEDILEEIVGEISDEFDEEEKMWAEQRDGSIVFEGKISLNDFFKVTDIDEDELEDARGDAETLAGFLLEINGLIPHKHDVISYKNYKFEIIAADARKIKKVRFSKTAPTEEKETKR